MIIKRGRFGTFLACTGYPDCKTTRRLVQGTKKAHQPDVPLDEKCPTCGEGQLLRRHGRFGEFIGCEKYPKCKYTRPDHARHQMPEVQRRRIRAPRLLPRAEDAAHFLRLQPLPGLRFHHAVTNRSTSRARSAVRRSSSRSAPSRAISAPASRKAATGKSRPRFRRSNRWAHRRHPLRPRSPRPCHPASLPNLREGEVSACRAAAKFFGRAVEIQ